MGKSEMEKSHGHTSHQKEWLPCGGRKDFIELFVAAFLPSSSTSQFSTVDERGRLFYSPGPGIGIFRPSFNIEAETTGLNE